MTSSIPLNETIIDVAHSMYAARRRARSERGLRVFKYAPDSLNGIETISSIRSLNAIRNSVAVLYRTRLTLPSPVLISFTESQRFDVRI